MTKFLGPERAFIAAFMLLVTMPSVQAGEPRPETVKAQVAGYKVVFTCGATFNGGKSPDMISHDELDGIRADYRKYFDELPDAKIHRAEKYVSAWYSDDMPPRYAVWRPGLGCTQLPTGADLAMAKNIPTVDPDLTQDNAGMPWPFGDGLDGELTPTAALKAVINDAFTTDKYGDPKVMSAALVTTSDRMLIERYKPGYTPFTSQRTWSTAKSVAATVIGVAVEKGLVNIKAPANIPAWSAPGDPRQAITLENLLHMASGLDSDLLGHRTSEIYFGGGLVTDNATGRMLEAKPGTRFKYANNDTLLAILSLKTSLGDTKKMLEFPAKNLFRKIGMNHTVAEIDWQGNFILSSQIWTTSRDLGRLGILYLNDGVWQGERILPEGWRDYVSSPAPAQPDQDKADGTPAAGYGAQFWLFPGRFPGMPDDAFTAAGNRGQFMMVVPSRNLVIIRRGYDNADGPRFNIAKFSADILRALDTK
ncbi:Beta-lactamase class C-like and penicillin binding proteins (PBPs) superfamily [hydrothermal vent metagenome]|uniref:Beta-lactamase class C-like and penicillin binding proteins (PBPs) superfamily n=1 Tax=hydrothermal vent metagenome TaxID=652676 RepID=A0A3B0RTZ2_9ZZZZ